MIILFFTVNHNVAFVKKMNMFHQKVITLFHMHIMGRSEERPTGNSGKMQLQLPYFA